MNRNLVLLDVEINSSNEVPGRFALGSCLAEPFSELLHPLRFFSCINRVARDLPLLLSSLIQYYLTKVLIGVIPCFMWWNAHIQSSCEVIGRQSGPRLGDPIELLSGGQIT